MDEGDVTSAAAPAGSRVGASDDGAVVHLWSEGRVQVSHGLDEVVPALADPGTRLWIDLEDATAPVLARVGSLLGLHELVAEDIIERRQRAKIAAWEDSLHIVLFALDYEDELSTSEVDIVLGRRFLLTSHPASWRPVKTIGADRRGIGSLLAKGTDMLLYAVIDPIVDACFPVIDRISDELDDLEREVLARPDASVVERLFRVRRSLVEVRHVISPEREILNQLAGRDLPLIDPAHQVYFRDLYDHAIRLTDELDTHRELAGGVLDAYLSSVNNNLSEVMKRLTAITAVLAGIGAAAGIFGMSEASSALDLPAPLGFWLVTAIVAAIGVVVFAYFRRIDWI